MSGTIRSRMEAQRDRHSQGGTNWYGKPWCEFCDQIWPCPDRVAADETITDLNNAVLANSSVLPEAYRLIPDPDSRGATCPE